MSETITYIEAGPVGLNERGHVSRDVAIATLKRHLERELERAREGLLCIEIGAVRVFHQKGINVVRDRHEVTE